MEGIGVIGGDGSDTDGEELQAFEQDRIFASTQGPRKNCARTGTIGFETHALYSLGNAFALMRLQLYFDSYLLR